MSLVIVTFATLIVFVMGSVDCSYGHDQDGRVYFNNGGKNEENSYVPSKILPYADLTMSFFRQQTPEGVSLENSKDKLPVWQKNKLAHFKETFDQAGPLSIYKKFAGEINALITSAWKDYRNEQLLAAKPEAKPSASKDSKGNPLL